MAYRGEMTPQLMLHCAITAGVVKEQRDSTFYCNACDTTLTNKDTMKTHLRSKVHSENSIYYNFPWATTVQTSDSSGTDPSDDDKDDELVKKAMRDGTIQDDTLNNPLSPYWCDVCQRSLKLYGRLANHLHSNKHKAKASHRPVNQERERAQTKPSKEDEAKLVYFDLETGDVKRTIAFCRLQLCTTTYNS
ncbi:uncharacterized protein [Macrobrachium rosenbergii]|uniref:uncharacterized protein isoform X1 n=2 Tax=Macrobrachium rosenbergii TaxID=79674 RepID=UPI0034D473B5